MATAAFMQTGNISTSGQHFSHLSGLGNTIEVPFKCVHHAFEYQARTHPENTAVEGLTHAITFSELDRRANCLAVHLRSKGVGPNVRVALLVERSISMVVGILAILKAGAAYIPLDGHNTLNKPLDHAIRNSGSSLVLVQRRFVHRVRTVPIICLEDSICDSPSSTHCVKPEDLTWPNDSAYIIYTTGLFSCALFDYYIVTDFSWIFLGGNGVPRGIDVMHKNITNCEHSDSSLQVLANLNLACSGLHRTWKSENERWGAGLPIDGYLV